MKTNIKSILISWMMVMTVVSVSCQKEIHEPIDKSLPGTIELTYDATNSDESSIAVYWDARPALKAGAKSFTLQLVKRLADNAGDIYDQTLSKTFSIDTVRAPGFYIFEGLLKDSRYYVRGRANYPGSQSSPWEYLCRPDRPSDVAVIKVGTGLFDGPVTTVTGVYSQLISATESTLTFGMSSTEFKDSPTDVTRAYHIYLYKDRECKDLFVSWAIPANHYSVKQQPRFIFTGLEPSTAYYFKVADTTDPDPMYSEVLEARTTQSFAKAAVTSNAAAGDVILYEDFSELLFGGSYLNEDNAAGYNLSQMAKLTEIKPVTGLNPVGGLWGYALTGIGRDCPLFNNLDLSINTTRLGTWGWLNEGDLIQTLCGQAGHLKAGTSAGCAMIVTPALNCLTDVASLEVSFKAQRTNASAGNAMILEMLLNATAGPKHQIIVENPSDRQPVKRFEAPSDLKLKEYTFRVDNVPVGARFALGGDVTLKSSYPSFLIDDISIKLLKYGVTEIIIPTPQIDARAATAKIISVSWEAVENASHYQVEYRKSGAGEWTVAGTTDVTTYVINDLEPETTYEVRVKGTKGVIESQYSTATVVMPEDNSGVMQRAVYVNDSQIALQWTMSGFTDVTADQSYGYRVGIYTDEACTQKLWNWTFSELGLWNRYVASGEDNKRYVFNNNGSASGKKNTPGVVLSGLTPSTRYWVKVENMTNADKTVRNESVASYTTTASEKVSVPSAPAAAGAVILMENFNELKWGGEPIALLAGYSSTQRGSATSIANPSGDNPGNPLYMTSPTQDMQLFGTLKNSIVNTSLKDWKYYLVDNNVAGLAAMCGCVKFAASSTNGYLVSPSLTCLSGKADVDVTFTAAANAGDKYCRLAVFPQAVEGIATFGIDVTKVEPVYESDPVELTDQWKEYTVRIEGVAPGSRIAIGTKDMSTTVRQFYLTDFTVSLVKYGNN